MKIQSSEKMEEEDKLKVYEIIEINTAFIVLK